jgi:hypothetical protein
MVSRGIRHGHQCLRSTVPNTSNLLHHVAVGASSHTSNDELESGNAGRDLDHSYGLLHHQREERVCRTGCACQARYVRTIYIGFESTDPDDACCIKADQIYVKKSSDARIT